VLVLRFAGSPSCNAVWLAGVAGPSHLCLLETWKTWREHQALAMADDVTFVLWSARGHCPSSRGSWIGPAEGLWLPLTMVSRPP
jgi:hypothetical protein